MVKHENKHKIILVLVIIILLTSVISGCENISIIQPRIEQAVSGGSRAQDAVEWLILNEEIVIPELLNRISSSNEANAKEAIAVLVAMGDVGSGIAMNNFNLLSASGKSRVVQMISAKADKDTIMKLLALSIVDGAFDISVEALINMGDISKDFLTPMLYDTYYYDAINSVLAGLGTSVVDDLISYVSSSNKDVSKRALTIISMIGDDAITPMLESSLSQNISNADAKLIAETALINNVNISLISICNIYSKEISQDYKTGAYMLYLLGVEQNVGQIMSICALSENTQAVTGLLDEYVKLTGVKPLLDVALKNQDSTILLGVQTALGSGDHSKETLGAILNSITATDDENSYLYTLCTTIIHNSMLNSLSQAILKKDPQALMAALEMEHNPQDIGDIFTFASENIELINRVDTMISFLDAQSSKNILTAIANADDVNFPTLVWNRYTSEDVNLSNVAGDALLSSVASGRKFKYNDINFTSYAQKLLDGSNSNDDTISSIANQLLERIPEGNNHNEFYQYIFNHKPDQRIFQILCSHFNGANALPLIVKVTSGEKIVAPSSLTYTLVSNVSKVDEKNYPDFNSFVQTSFRYLGIATNDTGEIKVNINIDVTPKSTWYKGMRDKSYLGAKSDCTITISDDSGELVVAKGQAIIEPPTDNPVADDDKINEYMNDPKDAPMKDVALKSYIDALGKAFGIEALYAMYQYDRAATIDAASYMWE